MHRRHERAWFEIRRIVYKFSEIRWSVWHRGGGDRLATSDMREIWTKSTCRHRASNRVATDACVVHKHIAAFGGCGVFHCGLPLVFYPGSELLWSIGVHTNQHLGMLHAAVLCTLSQVQTLHLGIDPHCVDFVRN